MYTSLRLRRTKPFSLAFISVITGRHRWVKTSRTCQLLLPCWNKQISNIFQMVMNWSTSMSLNASAIDMLNFKLKNLALTLLSLWQQDAVWSAPTYTKSHNPKPYASQTKKVASPQRQNSYFLRSSSVSISCNLTTYYSRTNCSYSWRSSPAEWSYSTKKDWYPILKVPRECREISFIYSFKMRLLVNWWVARNLIRWWYLKVGGMIGSHYGQLRPDVLL